MTTLDTETALIRPGVPCPKLACLSTSEDQGRIYYWTEAEPVALRLYTSGEVKGHNIRFDSAVLIANYPRLLRPVFEAYDDGRVICTQVREQLRLIAAGDMTYREDDPDAEARAKVKLDLATLARIYLRVHLPKADTWRLRYGELIAVPLEDWPEEAKVYPIRDAVTTDRVFDAQGTTTPEDRRQTTYDFALYLEAVWGVRTDPVRVEALRTSLLEENAKLSEALIDAGLMRPNPKNKSGWSKNKKLIQTLVQEHYDGKAPLTAKGLEIAGTRPLTDDERLRFTKTDGETLEQCTDHPVLAHAVKWDANGKILSTYVEPMARATERPLNSRPNVLVNSGRTSWRDPNLQNFPKLPGIRECFVPRPGRVFINADYDSLELRALAQVLLDLVGTSTLAEKYQQDPDYDPHTDFAASLLGISYEEAMARKDRGDPDVLAWRQRSKAANFGYPGGMGAAKFIVYARGYGLELSASESEHLRNQWFAKWPEMHAYFRLIKRLANDGAPLVQLRSGRVRGKVGFCDGANSYFQGLAADGAKAGLWMIQKACYVEPESALYGSRLIAFVHDEHLGEAERAKAQAALDEMIRLMIAGMRLFIPDVPIRASGALMDRWYKSLRGLKQVEGVWTDG